MPIELTEDGIIIEVNPEQSSNALSPIEVTPLHIVTDFMELLYEYHGLEPYEYE